MGCEFSVPVATESDYQVVHQKPAVLFDNAIQPVANKGSTYHLKMRRKIWRTWTNDTFGVKYANDGRPFEANVRGVVWTARDKMILQNLRGEPIGVMLKMWGRFERTFKIYGFHPCFPGQAPSSQQREQGRPLYAWAEVKHRAFSVQYEMTTPDGAVYVADRVGSVMGKLAFRLSRNGKFCAMVQHESYLSGFQGPVWDLQIVAGIDPVLIIGFTAIVDELVEIANEQD